MCSSDLEVTGTPSHTIANGKIVYAKGELRAVKGAGRYIKRPAYPSAFGALDKLKKDALAVVR